MMYGIKRGLYSNEAGVGLCPNAAAAADVSHPKQGLGPDASVFIDAPAHLCTATHPDVYVKPGVTPTADIAGAPYVQQSGFTVLGGFWPCVFVTIAMVPFAFTTLFLGNSTMWTTALPS